MRTPVGDVDPVTVRTPVGNGGVRTPVGNVDLEHSHVYLESYQFVLIDVNPPDRLLHVGYWTHFDGADSGSGVRTPVGDVDHVVRVKRGEQRENLTQVRRRQQGARSGGERDEPGSTEYGLITTTNFCQTEIHRVLLVVLHNFVTTYPVRVCNRMLIPCMCMTIRRKMYDIS